MNKWKLLEEKDVSPSKWFPIKQHKVELPNGKIIDDYFISPLGDVAMVLPILKTGEIVLVKQYKHAIDEIMVELPAGFQQKDKTLPESALAELEEEVGIQTDIKNLEFIGKFSNNPTKTTHITHSFLARNLEFNSKQRLDSTEEIEIMILKPGKVLQMIQSQKIWVADTITTILYAYLKYPELFKDHD